MARPTPARPDEGGVSVRRGSSGRPRAGLGDDELEAITSVFRALSDPTRLRILSTLAGREACVHELCDALALSQPAVSHQLGLMRALHLVRGRRVGREVFYSLDDEHVMELVGQARHHVAHLPGRRPPARRRAGA